MAYNNVHFNVDFKHSYLAALERLDQEVNSGAFKFFRYIFTILGIAALAYFLIGIFIWPSNLYAGLGLISLAIFSFFEA